MIEQSAGVVWQLVDAWNARDLAGVSRLCSDDYFGINVGEASPQMGADGLSRSLAEYQAAFPDLYFAVGETVVQGNRVAYSWTATGTHMGRLMNIPATGRRVEVQGVTMLTLEHGLIRKGLHVWDVAGLLRQIGLLPDL